MNETDANSERLRALEDENKALRRQLEEKPEVDEDLYSYRIFVEARKKLFAWIAGAALLLTAFGVYSLKDIVDEVRSRVDAKATEQVMEEIKDRIYEEHKDKLLVSLERELTKQVQGQIPSLLAQLEDRVQTERADIATLAYGEDARPMIEAYQQARADQRYYVIAGSSPVELDLERELRSVRDEVGDEFDDLFPNVKIYPPLGRNTNYALVIDGNLSREDATDLKQRAMKDGFRDDTFLWNADNVNFKVTTK